MRIEIVPVLQDNYAYILQAGGECAVVDPGEAGPVIRHLDRHGLTPSLILNTHHHGDHIAGNAQIIARYGCKLAAPEDERIASADIILNEGTRLSVGGQPIRIIETPGHTRSHICLYVPEGRILFSGDTLFSMGCGRLFEGTAAEMFSSLSKIAALPDETMVYCGHEYTLANGKFCAHIEPENEDIARRIAQAEELRVQGNPTLPVSLDTEKRTNVFLRAKTPEALARLRALKDDFR